MVMGISSCTGLIKKYAGGGLVIGYHSLCISAVCSEELPPPPPPLVVAVQGLTLRTLLDNYTVQYIHFLLLERKPPP